MDEEHSISVRRVKLNVVMKSLGSSLTSGLSLVAPGEVSYMLICF